MLVLLICFLLLNASPAAYAQLKNLTINADKVTVEKEKNQIEARGSVEVSYKSFLLHASHVVYNTSAEVIYAGSGFNLFYPPITVEGKTLDYKIKEAKGAATGVNFLYRGGRLQGGQLKFDDEKYEIYDAAFTTCDLAGPPAGRASPHYRVTAANLLLYPGHGWLVAYWGLFWLGNLPVVPLPTYIYDFRSGERAQKNLPPFPTIGNNDEDGNYINETLAWHLRREFSGSYTFGYTAYKGFGLGVNARYIIDARNEGDLRLNWNPKNQTFGGLTHLFSFGGAAPVHPSPFNFFQPRQYELEATLSSRERINYQRVSFLPDFALRSRPGSVFREEAQLSWELSSGLVAEEGNTKLLRGGGQLKFYGEFPESKLGFFTPSLGLTSSFYSNGGRWLKPSLGLEWRKNFSPDFSFDTGYFHYLFVDGGSPFNFENYRFRAVDSLKNQLRFKLGDTAVKLASVYFIDNWSPQDIDASLFFQLHCYNLEVTYRWLRREFMLGVSLVTI
jgi:hypothetical protein